MDKMYNILANLQHYFFNFLRISIFIVMAWIGGLKFYAYEADGIVPFVANSPTMNFFYSSDSNNYAKYKNPEGKIVLENIEWHKQNKTYQFAVGLGILIILIGSITFLGIWFPKVGMLGGILTFLMSIVTLSFLITTPEVYVPNLGGDYATPYFGFPFLSGSGRLVLKDIIMMAGGLLIASDSAKSLLRMRQ